MGATVVESMGRVERAALVAAFARLGFVAEETGTGGGCMALYVRHSETVHGDENVRHALVTNGDAGLPWSLTAYDAGDSDDDTGELDYAVVACVYNGWDCEGRLVLDDTASDADVDTVAAHIVDALRDGCGCC